MKITSSITINAEISKVFSIFTDLSKTPEIVSGILSMEVLEGPEQLAMGTKWKETRKMFGKEATETMWVSAFTENKSYSFDAESHGTKYRSTVKFEEVEGGTKVDWEFVGTPQTFGAKMMGVLGVLFSGSMKKLIDNDLQEFKKACEASV